jgi:LPXTG-motif cell wall-anchored protein
VIKFLKQSLKLLFLITFFTFIILNSSSYSRAVTITVDGNISDWASVVIFHNDPRDMNPTDITTDNSDVQRLYITNDSTNLYIRVDVFGTDPYQSNGELRMFFDSDNNTSTGFTRQGVPGIDRQVFVDSAQARMGVGCTNGSIINTTFCQSVSTNIAYAIGGNSLEVGIPLSELGLSSIVCSSNCSIPLVVFSDNQDTPDDDLVPDSASSVIPIIVSFATPSPTNTATPTPSTLPNTGSDNFNLISAGMIIVFVSSAFLLSYKRIRHNRIQLKSKSE